MSSLTRSLAGPSLVFRLADHIAELRAEDAYRRSGRAGRTLAKSGRFRLTLVAVESGVAIGTHQADSPMTLQVVEGGLHYRDEEGAHELRQGDVLFFGPGFAEDIRATADSALLITISALDDDDYRADEGTGSSSQ